VLDDAWLALRAGAAGGRAPPASRMLRTRPPTYAAGAGVAQLTYSGSYPLARLAVDDAALPVVTTAFAFSTLTPGDPAASAFPAAVLTLAVSNPDPSTPFNVSWAFALPFGATQHYGRPSNSVLSATPAGAYADCLHACAATPGCASWTWAAGVCALAADTPWCVYAEGTYSGVQGGWTASGGALTLSMHPGAGEGNASNGDVTLQPVVSGGADGGAAVSFGVSDDPGALWRAFAADGGFAGGQPGVTAGAAIANTTAAHGAAAVAAVVPPGGNLTLSIVFAWHFPGRDHYGPIVGNFYATLWPDSGAVAAALADATVLAGVAATLNAHHAVFAHPASPLPDWLTDHLVNQMSHLRGLIWTRDGRMREFEANDSPDGALRTAAACVGPLPPVLTPFSFPPQRPFYSPRPRLRSRQRAQRLPAPLPVPRAAARVRGRQAAGVGGGPARGRPHLGGARAVPGHAGLAGWPRDGGHDDGVGDRAAGGVAPHR
jgi:hypothetical protein